MFLVVLVFLRILVLLVFLMFLVFLRFSFVFLTTQFPRSLFLYAPGRLLAWFPCLRTAFVAWNEASSGIPFCSHSAPFIKVGGAHYIVFDESNRS